MANYHVRHGTQDGNSFQVVFHIPIPSANNRAGVDYRTALVKSGIGGKTQLTEGLASGEISTTEKTQILNGEVYEHAETFNTNPGETAAELQARVDARYNALVSIIQGRLQKVLTYWGYDRTIN